MKRFMLWSALFLAGLPACTQTGVPLERAGEQIPAPGYSETNSWRYRVVNQTFSGVWKSNLLNGDFEITLRNGAPKVVQVVGDKTVEVYDPGPLAFMLPTEAVVRAETQYFSFPLWIGKEWRGWELWQHKWRGTHCWVTGMETVVTPAGTFSAYRIERDIRIYVGIRNFYRTEIYFYSPQTRSVVKFDSSEEMKDLVGDQRYGVQETFSIELVDLKN